MTTLHIEHAITDYPTWRNAFQRFTDTRSRAGVTAHRIRRPVDDERYVVVDLDFDDAEAAERFKGFLHENVWGTDQAPALVGTPQARVLEDEN